jgi:HK97 gp10 family phage protein
MTRVKITQDTECLDNMDALTNDLLFGIGDFLKARAKMYAPVDTGELRDSIEVIAVDTQKKTVDVGAYAEHAIYQELGTRKQSGTPYLRPSLDDLESELGK